MGIEDIALVGGKNASLGEMRKKTKVKIPNGFVVTAYAYRLFLEKAGLLDALKEALKGLDIRNQQALDQASEKARNIILNSEFPPELASAITKAYKALSNKYKTRDLDVAVRSSATAEDLPHASFAGQQESFLNISGIDALLKACKRSFASLFTSRAIVYRHENKFDHFKVYLSIGIQKMIRSDLASAGVIFTLDTETGFKNVLFITGSYGLGESVVQGAVNPDEFYVFKPTLEKGFKPIIDKRLGEKASKIIYSKSALSPTKRIDTPLKERNRFCLSDKEILQLSKWSLAIEKHYSKRYGKWTPMDIEWAKDGKTKELYIVQARPETVQSQRKSHVIEEYRLLEKGKVLAKGKSVGNKIAIGIARVIKSPKDISKFKKGEILVTEITDPDWVPIMKRASAIITDRGGRTSHAAIVSRELGLPCIVGTNDATKKIKTGDKVTVSPIEGENGIVY
ncbi:MAG: phosphoenolpyruvate synthase, partial [Parachlamydiaceae bacterium]